MGASGLDVVVRDRLAAYEQRVTAMAAALHADCLLEWQAAAIIDPGRMVTMHMADAHYGKAHALVRRLFADDGHGPPI